MEHSLPHSAHSRTPFQHSQALDADQYPEPTIRPGRAPLPDLTAGDVSDSTEALNFLLTALQCPKGARAVIDATVGFVAGRSSRIEFYHFDLGRRMEEPVWYDDEEEKRKERERIERNVRNKMAALQDWIAKWNLPIRYTPGSRTPDDESIPSTLIFPLVDWAAEVVNTARQEPRFPVLNNAERANLFRRTVKTVLRRHKINVKPTDKARTKRKQDSSQILATIETLSGKYVAQICDEQKIEREAASDFLLRQLASRLPAKVWGVQVKTFRETDTETDVLAAKSYLDPLYPDIQVNICEKQEGSQGGDDSDTSPDDPLRYTEALDATPPVILSSDLCVSDFGPEAEAKRAVEAFDSVGVEITGYLFKNDETKERESGDETTTAEFAAEAGELIVDAELGGVSLIAHLRGPVLQVEDVTDPAALEELRRLSFLQAETSEGRFHSFIAFDDPAIVEELRPRLLAGLAARFGEGGGNSGPSGEGGDGRPYAAIRFPGSINAKPGRDGWRVRLVHTARGRSVTAAELDAAGLLAPVEPKDKPATKEQVAGAAGRGKRPGRFPDYGRSLSMARRKEDGTPDRSHADWLWATLALKWGWSIEATEAELLNVSGRGEGRHGGRYARRTVRKAAQRVGA